MTPCIAESKFCGRRIPDREHAVSVSLPCLRDVIGYEEQQPSVMQHICSGYPRFVTHWMVQKVQDLIGDGSIALRDHYAVEQIRKRFGTNVTALENGYCAAVRMQASLPSDQVEEIRCFLQHTGLQLSSREAEDILVEEGIIRDATDEGIPASGNSHSRILAVLSGIYGVSPAQFHVFPSGMSAFYSVFEAIRCLPEMKERPEWIQIGWLYLDTSALLQRYAGDTRVFAVDALDDFAAYLALHHERVAAVTTEVMTNPLMQTTDIPRLSALCKAYHIPLIIDISMPTPVNVDVLAYADITIESLTKFAGGHADVMAGVAVFSPQSQWADMIQSRICASRPYLRDLHVMAHHIGDYVQRVQQVNRQAQILADTFRSDKAVRVVYDASQAGSRANYDAVRRDSGGYGGVISVVFRDPLEKIYDSLSLRKGPSFGTVFTLCMPYVYLAHYDLLQSKDGRRTLRNYGVDPELLRISVGVEPIDSIIAAFEAAMV